MIKKRCSSSCGSGHRHAAHGSHTGRAATRHWLAMQITAVALIPLSLYLLFTFFAEVVFGNGYESAINWLHAPVNGVAMILTLGLTFFHGFNGVISGLFEDYVHDPFLNRVGVRAVQAVGTLFALAGTASVIKIMIGV